MLTNNKMISLRRNHIYNSDSIEILEKIPSNSIDVIFADPPYNLQLGDSLRRPDETKVNGVSEEWDKFKSFKDYDEFTTRWLKESKRILETSNQKKCKEWMILKLFGRYYFFRRSNTFY